MRHVAGLVLTGGGSRRLGRDKATLLVDGESLADRTTRLLASIATPVIEVGPGFTSTDAVSEDAPGSGPLAAIAAGGDELRRLRAYVPVVVVAVDLPRLDTTTLCWLADHPAATDAVVPLVDGRAQPLCARYEARALARASELVRRGERSMGALLDAVDVHYSDERDWGPVTDPRAFADVDTPAEAAALGVELPR